MDKEKNICVCKYIETAESSIQDTYLLDSRAATSVFPNVSQQNSEDYLRKLLMIHDNLSSIY